MLVHVCTHVHSNMQWACTVTAYDCSAYIHCIFTGTFRNMRMHGTHCRTQSMQAISVEGTMRLLQRVATLWAAVAMMASPHTHVRASLESWEMGSTGLGGAPADGQGRVASGAVVTVDNTKPRVDECVTLACRTPPTHLTALATQCRRNAISVQRSL
jgi:hypothetical protein